LIFMLGEQFNSLNIIGSVLSIRGRETIIELWFNYYKTDEIKNEITEKMITLLELDNNKIFFKDHSNSIKVEFIISNDNRINQL
jgi:hypothetical protein